MPFSNNHISLQQPYLDRSVHFNVEHTLSGRKQVSNLQPTRLYYVACGHIYKYCVYHKNTQKLRRLSIALVTFPHEAHCRKKVGDP
jgi:hypothetical protein